MFDMGFLELLVIAVIGLLVLGPERLPQVLKKLSSFITKSRYFANNLKEEFEREANLSEMRESLKQQQTQFQDGLNSQLDEVRNIGSEIKSEAPDTKGKASIHE